MMAIVRERRESKLAFMTGRSLWIAAAAMPCSTGSDPIANQPGTIALPRARSNNHILQLTKKERLRKP